MAIVRAFEEWRPELQSVENPIQVLSNHKNLGYIMSTKLQNNRQARWSQFLSQLNFRIVYRAGKAGGKPHALTCRSGDLPKEGDERQKENFSTLIKPHDVIHLLVDNDANDNGPTLDQIFEAAYMADPFPNKVLTMLDNGTRHSREISLGECGRDDNILTFRSRLFVSNYEPLRLRLMQPHHESPVAGHPGRSKSMELLSQTFYWPQMRKDVECFVRNCHTCQRSRTTRHAPYGILRALPIPDRPWQDILMDFVTGLP
jgi:hypothetical protein